MAKPEGIAKKTKDNSNKHPHQREDFEKGKRLNRPKQVWNAETKTWSKQ